jgi:hypothetical protein
MLGWEAETMGKMLLEQFFEEKMRGYVEPQRQGTPKGEPIGLSTVKFRASLLMLTNKRQKEMAQELGISHGLLRKWGTEEAFKKSMADHCNEYSLKYIEYVHKKILEGEKLIKIPHEGSSIGFDEENKIAGYGIGFMECGDSNSYSIDLANTIMSRSLSFRTRRLSLFVEMIRAELPYSAATVAEVFYRLPIAVLAAHRYGWAEPPLSRMGAEEQQLIKKISKELKKMVTVILLGEKSHEQRMNDETMAVQLLIIEERMNK